MVSQAEWISKDYHSLVLLLSQFLPSVWVPLKLVNNCIFGLDEKSKFLNLTGGPTCMVFQIISSGSTI